MNWREHIFAAVDDMRSIPVGAVNAVRLLNNPDVDLNKVIPVIERDPGWTANLLRLANSAYFGCRRSVASVRDAFVRLGTRTVLQLGISSALLPVLKSQVHNYGGGSVGFWGHSVGVAVGSQELVNLLSKDVPEYVFTAAVLHTIGKVVICKEAKKMLPQLTELIVEEGMDSAEAELELLGVDYAEIGGEILSSWGLPDGVVNATRWHLNPEQSEIDDLACDIIYVVNILALKIECDKLDEHELFAGINQSVIDTLELKEKHIKKVVAKLNNFYANTESMNIG